MKISKLAIILTFFTNILLAQQSRIAITGIDVIAKKEGFFSLFGASNTETYHNVPRYCIDFMSNNKKFISIDRQNLTLINKELELQKSENFIDGYIVEQGKSEGVDYILKPFYYSDSKTLNVRIYNVADGTVKCSKDTKIETSFSIPKNLERQTVYMLHDLMYECFNIKSTVMRTVDPKDDKAKLLLVSMGRKNKINVEDEVEIFVLTEEKIDDEVVSRKEVLGKGEVKVIQDDNFSEVKTTNGNLEIANALKNGKKVYARIINQYTK